MICDQYNSAPAFINPKYNDTCLESSAHSYIRDGLCASIRTEVNWGSIVLSFSHCD